MITDKVLIVHDFSFSENEGGPRGYYYKCLHNNLPNNITSLRDEIHTLENISVNKKLRVRVDKYRGRKYKNKFLANKFIKLPRYKYLYFHDLYSFNDVAHLIKKDQVVIFQCHSPELPSTEEQALGAKGKKLKAIQVLEKKIFKRANILILPNKGCLSIYESVIKKDHNFFYVPTGVMPIKVSFKYPIVQDNYVNILYIGRRNSIKGFDILISEFKKAIKTRKDLRLFIIGGGETIVHENIYDIGFSSNVYEWINSVDFVISPNKKSYFDLNILESIALGTPLLMTTTEGHEYFKNKKGIISFTEKSLTNTLLDNRIVCKAYKNENKMHLLQLYKDHLSDKVLKKTLEEVVCKILKMKCYIK